MRNLRMPAGLAAPYAACVAAVAGLFLLDLAVAMVLADAFGSSTRSAVTGWGGLMPASIAIAVVVSRHGSV